MDTILTDFTIGGVAGIALVVGITQVIKSVWHLEGRAAVILAAVVSALVALAAALTHFFPQLTDAVYYVVVAVVLWLASAGAYSVGATVAKGIKKDEAKNDGTPT